MAAKTFKKFVRKNNMEVNKQLFQLFTKLNMSEIIFRLLNNVVFDKHFKIYVHLAQFKKNSSGITASKVFAFIDFSVQLFII